MEALRNSTPCSRRAPDALQRLTPPFQPGRGTDAKSAFVKLWSTATMQPTLQEAVYPKTGILSTV